MRSQRPLMKVATAVTIGVVALISFVSTAHLAAMLGMGAMSWLYPICLDAAAAVGMSLWLSDSPALKPARALTLAAVALSLAANVSDWLMTSGAGAAVLGAVPPLMLAALLLVVHKDSEGRAAATRRETPAPVEPEPPVESETSGEAPRPPRKPRPRRPSAKSPSTTPPKSDPELIELIREREQNGETLSRRIVMSDYSLGSGRATRTLADARNGHHIASDSSQGE